MKIRKATKKDAEEIAQVEIDSGYPHGDDFDALKRTKELFEDKNWIILVGLVNGKIIGYRAFELKDRVAEPGFLAIRKEYQTKGFGRKLLEHSIKYAKKKNCKLMRIGVRESNVVARKLYEKLGFRIEKSFVHNNKVKMEMVKELV